MRDLEQRARRVRSRSTTRGWEYRQRHRAKGVWFRLRRVLADASDAYRITEADAAALLAEGFLPEPVGTELQPNKTILFVPPERLEHIVEKSPLPIRLAEPLLGARFLALVRFPREGGG